MYFLVMYYRTTLSKMLLKGIFDCPHGGILKGVAFVPLACIFHQVNTINRNKPKKLFV